MLPKFAYFKGEIVPYNQASVGVATHALNYGTGAFAGVRAYWNADEEQLFIFRPPIINGTRCNAGGIDRYHRPAIKDRKFPPECVHPAAGV